MIIVTGGAGFIGSSIIWALNHKGITDIVIVEDVEKNHISSKNLTYLEYKDYENRHIFLKKLQSGAYKNIEAIIHMGACSSTLVQDVSYFKEINLDYSIALGEWCVKNNVYFSYASSAAVYGDGSLGFADDMTLNEKLKPLNPYGQSKLDFDKWVVAHGYDKIFNGYRFFNVYGPNEYHKGPMISMVLRGYNQAISEKVIKLFKSYKPEYPHGGQRRDFVYIKDVIDVILYFLEKKNSPGIFNVGTGASTTWNELAISIWRSLNSPINIEHIEMPDTLKNQYQYFTEAPIAKLENAGWTRCMKTIFEGSQDYICTYLTSSETLGSEKVRDKKS